MGLFIWIHLSYNESWVQMDAGNGTLEQRDTQKDTIGAILQKGFWIQELIGFRLKN